MAFEIRYEENHAPQLIPEGKYECVIQSAREDVTQGGTVHLSIPLQLRRDVGQSYGGALLWHKLWRRKAPTADDLAVDGYSAKQIGALSRAAGIPNNQSFPSLAVWCQAISGKAVQADVVHEDYNGQTRARVQWVNPPALPLPEEQQAAQRLLYGAQPLDEAGPVGTAEADAGFATAGRADAERTSGQTPLAGATELPDEPLPF